MTGEHAAGLPTLRGPGEGYDEPDVAVAARDDRPRDLPSGDEGRAVAARRRTDRLNYRADLLRTAADQARQMAGLLTACADLMTSEGD